MNKWYIVISACFFCMYWCSLMEICSPQYIHTYSTYCIFAINCNSLFNSVSAHYYTVQMTTLQQCLKFCYRELYVPACVFSVTALASPVWAVAHASCLPKDALFSGGCCITRISVLCNTPKYSYHLDWIYCTITKYILIVSICCVVSLAYNIALWHPPCLSLYSLCLHMCLFVYAHNYQKMMECWDIEPDEMSLLKQLKSDLDKLLMIHLSDGCITFSEVDEDKLPYCKRGASNSENTGGSTVKRILRISPWC